MDGTLLFQRVTLTLLAKYRQRILILEGSTIAATNPVLSLCLASALGDPKQSGGSIGRIGEPGRPNRDSPNQPISVFFRLSAAGCSLQIQDLRGKIALKRPQYITFLILVLPD